MKNLIIVLLLLGLLSFSCSNSTSSDETERISLPLKVGNSWTYDVEVTQYSTEPTTVEQFTDITFTALSDTLIDEVQWFYLESGINKYDALKAGYYSNQEDGIYYRKSLPGSVSEKKNLNEFPISMESFTSESVDAGEMRRYPFIHNPDNDIPERLIRTKSVIGAVTYAGESENDDFNVITQDYFWNYYQQSVGNRTYTINPFDLNFSVSNDLGFTTYEAAYVSASRSTEEDPRLQLLLLYSFKLTEFKGD